MSTGDISRGPPRLPDPSLAPREALSPARLGSAGRARSGKLTPARPGRPASAQPQRSPASGRPSTPGGGRGSGPPSSRSRPGTAGMRRPMTAGAGRSRRPQTADPGATVARELSWRGPPLAVTGDDPFQAPAPALTPVKATPSARVYAAPPTEKAAAEEEEEEPPVETRRRQSQYELVLPANGVVPSNVIHPRSAFIRCWDMVTAIWVMYLCWSIPFTAGLYCWDVPKAQSVFHVLLDVWFMSDVMLRFHTGIVNGREIILDPERIRREYVRGWFLVDFVGSFPFDLVVPGLSSSNTKSIKLLKYFKIPKLLRLGRILRYLRQHAKYFGSLMAALLFLLSAHIIACVWVAYYDPCGREEAIAVGAWVLYREALHLTVVMLFGNVGTYRMRELMHGGEDWEAAVDDNGTDHVLACCVSVYGVFYLAVIFSNVATLLQSMNSKGMQFQSRLVAVRKEMQYFEIPRALQERVLHYYDYMWINRKGHLSLLESSELSSQMRGDLALHMYRDAVSRVPLFATADDDVLLARVCRELDFRVYLGDDFVVRKGEIGRELYVLNEGEVEVLSGRARREPGCRVLTRLATGSYFGEIALLRKNARRSVSVVCVGVCEVLALSKDAFDGLLVEFDSFRESMEREARERLAKSADAPLSSSDDEPPEAAPAADAGADAAANAERLERIEDAVRDLTGVVHQLAAAMARGPESDSPPATGAPLGPPQRATSTQVLRLE